MFPPQLFRVLQLVVQRHSEVPVCLNVVVTAILGNYGDKKSEDKLDGTQLVTTVTEKVELVPSDGNDKKKWEQMGGTYKL